ncbi:ABC transporter ATP-binding protein [Luteimonas sp. RIT-PG2_3]
MLQIQDLQIGYAGNALARLPQTHVGAGEFICLLGRNGQGKSTLLRTLGGFLAPLAGEARLGGRPVQALRGAERARRIAVVLTDRPQLGALGVTELVEMGRHPYTGWAGRLDDDDRRIASQALALVEGLHLAHRLVDSLSDGERQRAMIARALAQQPELMLLDEITAFLDLPSRVTIIDTLRRIAREQGMAIVLSSHDLELSLQTADRLWLLPGGGRFIDGVPEDVALSGEIGRAFDAANLTFSPATGRFEMPAGQGRHILLDAQCPKAPWLARALRRVGHVVCERGEVDDRQGVDHVVTHVHGDWHVDGVAAGAGIGDALAWLRREREPEHQPEPGLAPAQAPESDPERT